MKLGVRAKLFLISIGVIALTVIIADLYLTSAIERLLVTRIREDLLVRADLAAQKASSFDAEKSDHARWDALADDLGRAARARVTLIRADGFVLGDSEVPETDLDHIENHAARPEVASALAEGSGSSVRASATVHKPMIYVARAFSRGDLRAVARVALTLDDVHATVARVHTILFVGSLLAMAVAVLMSSAAAHFTSRTVERLTNTATRMAEGDLDARTSASGDDEIARLGRALDGLAKGLSTSLAALRAERDLLGRILDGMREGVLVVAGDGRVVLTNPSLRSMLLIGSDAADKSLSAIIRDDQLRGLLESARAEAPEAPQEIELGGIKPRRLLVHSAALPDMPGGLLAVLVDVTELRRLETLRRDFVANASHELRTPVTSVRSAAETLRAAMDDPDARGRFLDIIDRNAERLHRLIEDLLDLSRIESRELNLAMEALDVGPFTERQMGLLAERAERRNIALSSEIPRDLPKVRADPRALAQVMGNLLDNALKYCPEGSRVRVIASLDGERRDRVRIAVADTGAGIEERHLPRLFERFYRVDAGRSRELGGTGLGLSIVKHLVEAMGGAIRVESKLGAGTTFSFTLAVAS